MTTSTKSREMQAQYAAWPYPQVPLLAALPSTHPWELHVSWLWDRCSSGPAPAKPRIWIAGCGTFQPYAFAVANPHAEIVATDLSEPSLDVARRRCRWHRQRHVRFAPVDLADESTWPDGTFDLIECYGVLMNLADPTTALRRMAQRLTPGGVLRLMLYPHWSRQRVFQLQRVARLCGLGADDRSHPGQLRRFVQKLPKAHPLRYAFTTYADSKNDAGVVDGFLHKGDRGFTGFQLGALLRDAGMTPAYWFHRPWGQPDRMAERLDLQDRSQSFVLNYLDLWHELRANLVVCARRDDAPARVVQAPTPHPLFAQAHPSLRHKLRLARLGLLGGKLPTRTGDEHLVLRPQQVRALAKRADALPQDHPLLLGGKDHGPTLPAHEDFAGEARFLQHAAALRVGQRAPNPLYAHLFAAFELAHLHPELGLPDLEAQVGKWLPWADPLEERPFAFGLTPYGTLQKLRVNVREHLEREPLPVATDYGAVRLRGDATALARTRTLLAAADLPRRDFDDATLRELFVLLMTHDRLFVTFE
ncbi:MAG: class I SAM-dependent methyltransferase [Planctomycetes bacterium]|nr:class I SAM-dependent methyltransferase [Planctomycetota bacterium]